MKRAKVDEREMPDGYVGVCLGHFKNPNRTFVREHPKVRGKAAVKAAKKARMRARG